MVYTGTDDVTAICNFTFNFKQASGTDYNFELVFYKNGSLMNGGHIIVTAVSGEWRSATLSDMVALSTDDYVEVFIKGSSAFTLDVASASLIIHTVPA